MSDLSGGFRHLSLSPALCCWLKQKYATYVFASRLENKLFSFCAFESFNYGALFVDHKIFECAQLIIYLRIFVEALLYHLIKCVDPVLIILFTRLLMQMQMQENQNY